MTPPPSPAFIHPVRVYWEDTDAGGVVFYANYLKFFERARTEWLRQLGVEQQGLREQTGAMFVVSHTSVNYLAPARLDDLLNVSVDLAEQGRVALRLRQTARRQNDGQVLAEGDIRIACVDGLTLKPRRLPEALCRALAASSP